jgi:hypothetical protein
MNLGWCGCLLDRMALRDIESRQSDLESRQKSHEDKSRALSLLLHFLFWLDWITSLPLL